MLHIHPTRTTPYHPQTDRLVERFNKTLKSMLRKVANQEGNDWDRLIPYLVFAYREVPQSSTGFSPFEVLYGCKVSGPLDVLKEAWKEAETTDERIVSYVLTIREIGRDGGLSQREYKSLPEATEAVVRQEGMGERISTRNPLNVSHLVSSPTHPLALPSLILLKLDAKLLNRSLSFAP